MEWIVKAGQKTDLHIHSVFSKHKDGAKVINNTIENISILVERLAENGVNICSITDHDCFSYLMYKKLKENEGRSTLAKVLPGVEFSVSFSNEDASKVIHIVTIFDDIDEKKIEKIESVLRMKDGKPDYDMESAFSEDKYLSVLREIDIDTIMIAHQKNSLSSKGNAKKNDVTSLGTDKFNEFLFSEYFEAYEFRNKKNQLFNKQFIFKNDLSENLRMVTGSDCHEWEVYPKEDSHSNQDYSFTYFKCLPTFKGLVMAVTDTRRIRLENNFFNPSERCIEIIEFQMNGQKLLVPMSKGINVIIGDNSIGKSLLLHNLTGFSSRYNCKTSLKRGYEKYLNDKNVKIVTRIQESDIFRCDMQGDVRRQFDEQKISGSEFLAPFFPDNISTNVYKEAINTELEKLFGAISDKFIYDAKVQNLPTFQLVLDSQKSQSITFVAEIMALRHTELDHLVTGIKEVEKKIDTLSRNAKIDVVDKRTLTSFSKRLHIMQNKYQKKITEIELADRKKNVCRTSIRDFQKAYSRQTTDEQRVISDYFTARNDAVADVFNAVVLKCKLHEPVYELEETFISPNTASVYKYRFVAKVNIDSISKEYIKKLVCRVIKKGKEIDVKTLNSENLKSLILYYPNTEEKPLVVLIQKIKEQLDSDFSPKHSIIENEMDIYKDLSAGFNSQIYFTLISAESKNKGIYIIDQPEDHISQKAIRENILDRFKEMGENRQIFMVTHNPQFIVNLDVDNVVFLTADENGEFCVKSGALEFEDSDFSILKIVADNIEGGLDSISRRMKRYEKGI